jgi:exoribonuclease R
MQVKYMQDHKDQEFLGVISGVTEWGIYVEIIENKCEGMVRIRDIKTIIIRSMKNNMHWLEQLNQLLQLGDEIFVKVKNADLVKNNWILIS